MSLRLGLPLRGRGRTAEHDPSHAERRPPVVGAQSCWGRLVDSQHQHSAQNGGEGTGTLLYFQVERSIAGGGLILVLFCYDCSGGHVWSVSSVR